MAVKVDATSLAVGLEDGSIEIWERVGYSKGKHPGDGSKLAKAQPFKRLAPLQKHNDLVRVIDMSPTLVVSGSWDASLKLWNRKTGNLLDTYVSPEGPVSGIYLNESSNSILFSARSGKVKKLMIKDLSSLMLSPTFEINHGDCVIDMSVDKNYLLTGGSDAKLVLWTYDSGDKSI